MPFWSIIFCHFHTLFHHNLSIVEKKIVTSGFYIPSLKLNYRHEKSSAVTETDDSLMLQYPSYIADALKMHTQVISIFGGSRKICVIWRFHGEVRSLAQINCFSIPCYFYNLIIIFLFIDSRKSESIKFYHWQQLIMHESFSIRPSR